MTPGAPRRLHPATVILGSVKQLGSLPVFIPVAIALARIGWWALLGVALLWLVGAIVALLRWLKFTYTIEPDALVIEQGVLHRSRRVIPRERIQDVSIEQKPLQRLIGLVTLRIETGGGGADEGLLDGVDMAEAHRLRETLRGVAAQNAAPVDEAAPAAEQLLFAMPLGRVLLLGVFSFSLLWMVALGGLVRFADDVFDFKWAEVMRWLDIAGHEASARFGVLLTLTIAGALLALGFLSGLASALVRNYGFRLMRGEGRFRRVRGLLTRTEVVIAVRRVQLALIERRPVRDSLGWASLKLQTLGGSNDAGGRQEMAPFARADEIDRILDSAGLPRFDRRALRRVARAFGLRSLVRSVTPLALASAGVGLFLTPYGWLGLVLVPPAILVALLQRRFHRFALRPNDLQVMRGVIRRCDWIVPRASMQVVTIRQGPLQRLLGTASVLIDTAGALGRGRPEIEDLPVGQAIALAGDLAQPV